MLSSVHARPQDLGIQVYLPLAGSVRFEDPGAEQVGIITGLLEVGFCSFLCGPKF